MKENRELKSEIKKVEEGKKSKPVSENEKNLSKMLFNARKTIKEKEKQIEEIKLKSEKLVDK